MIINIKFAANVLFSMKQLSLIVIFFSVFYSYSQLDYKELSGVVRINDSLFIPYEIYLNKTASDSIEGYSITDRNGAHETKSFVKGYYNSNTKTLKLEEYDIAYTKSTFNTFDFCFIYLEEKVNNFDSFKFLKGKFNGKYTNGDTCINGEVILADKTKLEAKKEKLQRKIAKYQSRKEKRSLNVDTLKLENIVANEELNVFLNSNQCTLYIYDSGKLDNDRINLYIGEKLVLEDYAIAKEKKEIPLEVPAENLKIKVVALNEGTSAPNTVKIEIRGKGQFLETRTLLKAKESASLFLVNKRNP